jgi:hypothetical protein
MLAVAVLSGSLSSVTLRFDVVASGIQAGATKTPEPGVETVGVGKDPRPLVTSQKALENTRS